MSNESNENEGRPVKNLSEPWQEDALDRLVDVESHLWKAVFSTCFCCLPLGMVAIIYAALVKQALMLADVDGALKASKNANFWGNLSIITGIVLSLIVVASQYLID